MRMKNYGEKEALKIIIETVHEYDIKLNNWEFLIIYKDGRNYCCKQVIFKDFHFLHLTGVRSELNARHFYQRSLSGRLSTKDIQIDRYGKAQQKLHVLKLLPDILYGSCMIGTFINSGILIKADYFVGDTRAVISIGFRSKNEEHYSVDFPVSLYNDDVRKLTKPTNKVECILRKRPYELQYSKITYITKNNPIKYSDLPDTIASLIDLP